MKESGSDRDYATSTSKLWHFESIAEWSSQKDMLRMPRGRLSREIRTLLEPYKGDKLSPPKCVRCQTPINRSITIALLYIEGDIQNQNQNRHLKGYQILGRPKSSRLPRGGQAIGQTNSTLDGCYVHQPEQD